MIERMSSILTIFIILMILKSGALVSNTADTRIRRARTRHEAHLNSSIDNPRPDQNRRTCGTEQIEYRLTRLEGQVVEKYESLRTELHENNRRLHTLSFQNRALQTTLDSFRNELAKVGRSNRTNHYDNSYEFENRLEHLTRGVDLIVQAIKLINEDIATLKKSVIEDSFNRSPFWLEKDDVYLRTNTDRSCIKNVESLPRSCKEVRDRGNNVSGIYRIQPSDSASAFMVLCDMVNQGGGWTFIHNRYDGLQNFYLNWQSYKQGFGNLGGEFWIGLEYLHQLIGSEVNELLVELVDQDFNKAYAHYSAFSIGSELEGYPLKILGGYSGDAGDSLIYHAGSKFSTYDKDQDSWEEGSCAHAHHGAWWYKDCDTSNLNGEYLNGDLPNHYTYRGMYWGGFKGPRYSLLRSRMMIRPRNENSSLGFTNSKN